MHSADSDNSPGDRPPVAVSVLRTGGIAGLKREWRAEPPTDDAVKWIVLIDDCPWDEPASATSPRHGADRYIWSISAARGGEAHRARVADGDLVGPWRELVDAVRQFAEEEATRGA